ncbi:hypothetical protein N658DRAFT_199380 [Parathielavia hyrcaniae]|uniref:Uncharacterized protein n=1 Tax=Parathielavia hyrcaniae TaxID=113614 RepID=A0AAN6Q7L4_9PEZI|nr:hypothetical protein N658DRAFT_199380 [Parathielavia hyrcaniae]
METKVRHVRFESHGSRSRCLPSETVRIAKALSTCSNYQVTPIDSKQGAPRGPPRPQHVVKRERGRHRRRGEFARAETTSIALPQTIRQSPRHVDFPRKQDKAGQEHVGYHRAT